MSIEVILTKDVADVGRAGTVKKVAPGYARNFLFPRGLAVAATAGNMKGLELKRKRAEELAALEKADAQKAAEVLSHHELRFMLKAGELGQLYGSVSAADIAAQLSEKGIELERRKVLLKEPIKKTGLHLVEIRLHGEVHAKIRVIVDADRPPEPEKPKKKAAAAEAEPAEGAEASTADAQGTEEAASE